MSLEALLIGLLWVVIAIVVIGVVYWALNKLAAAIGAPPIVLTGIQVICVLLAVIVLLYWLIGVMPAGPWRR